MFHPASVHSQLIQLTPTKYSATVSPVFLAAPPMRRSRGSSLRGLPFLAGCEALLFACLALCDNLPLQAPNQRGYECHPTRPLGPFWDGSKVFRVSTSTVSRLFWW